MIDDWNLSWNSEIDVHGCLEEKPLNPCLYTIDLIIIADLSNRLGLSSMVQNPKSNLSIGNKAGHLTWAVNVSLQLIVV